MYEDRIILKDLRTRARFLNYLLLEQIGAGGEGTVWSAMDLEHDRIVAVKLTELNGLDGQILKDRIFDNQVEILLSLRHPHLLQTYDYGLSKNIQYSVSPYIPGGSLRDRLRGGELPMYDALRFAAETAVALDFLHDHDILHRDLKPSNLLLDFSHNIYVCDFGLARYISHTTQALHTGHGTPPYAPPEQHAMKVMSRQSDIFSFGILLFEMFTRRLPWDGEKSLGIQQLYSQEELPDPRTINPRLPPDLAKVLWHLTSVDPASRPASVGDALRELGSAFKINPFELLSDRPGGESRNRETDVQELLKRSLMSWETGGEKAARRLTDFALIELEYKQAQAETAPADLQRFMLHSALVFGLDDEAWWSRVGDPALKMDVAGSLVISENEEIVSRALVHLLDDKSLTSLEGISPGRLVRNLIETAGNTNSPSLRGQALLALRRLSPRSDKWRTIAFSDGADLALAHLALDDTPQGDEAARLIGQVRSLTAVEVLHRGASENRRIPSLLEVQKVAGSLPSSIPASTRLALSAELILGRFMERPLSIFAVFLMAYFGSALSVGIQNYLIIRIPSYMDVVRISVSLERGLFLGAFFSLGILLIRLIVERFPRSKVFPRLAVATVMGGFIFSVGLFTYNVLLVKIDLHGMLFAAGCLLAAYGFVQGCLLRSRLLRMLVAFGAVFSALALTWIIYRAQLDAGLDLSPLFYYESAWSPWQIAGTMLAFSLPISIFGNLFSLSIEGLDEL